MLPPRQGTTHCCAVQHASAPRMGWRSTFSSANVSLSARLARAWAGGRECPARCTRIHAAGMTGRRAARRGQGRRDGLRQVQHCFRQRPFSDASGDRHTKEGQGRRARRIASLHSTARAVVAVAYSTLATASACSLQRTIDRAGGGGAVAAAGGPSRARFLLTPNGEHRVRETYCRPLGLRAPWPQCIRSSTLPCKSGLATG